MNAIVVTDRNWAIGRENDLLFSLPTDMKRFRTLTLGGTVILGRKTLDSFPGGAPLPRRRNLVITRNAAFQREGVETFPTPEAALEAASQQEEDTVWLIGGASIYAALLPRCKRVYRTCVDAEAAAPDAFFPNLDALDNWSLQEVGEPICENGLTYRFELYVNQSL